PRRHLPAPVPRGEGALRRTGGHVPVVATQRRPGPAGAAAGVGGDRPEGPGAGWPSLRRRTATSVFIACRGAAVGAARARRRTRGGTADGERAHVRHRRGGVRAAGRRGARRGRGAGGDLLPDSRLRRTVGGGQ